MKKMRYSFHGACFISLLFSHESLSFQKSLNIIHNLPSHYRVKGSKTRNIPIGCPLMYKHLAFDGMKCELQLQ